MNASSSSFPEFSFHAPKKFTLSVGLGAAIMASIIGLVLFLLLLGWWYKKYHVGTPAPPPAADLEMQPPAATTTAPAGVDPALRRRIPHVIFHTASSSDTTATVLPRQQDTCVLCLSDFGEGDGISILPGCMHAFHTQCIDTYMDSFSTCPYCRSTITLEVGEEESSTTVIEEEQL